MRRTDKEIKEYMAAYQKRLEKMTTQQLYTEWGNVRREINKNAPPEIKPEEEIA